MKITLSLALVILSAYLAGAEQTNSYKNKSNNAWRIGIPTNEGVQLRIYTETNGQEAWTTNVNWWSGIWSEGSNGLRVQLELSLATNVPGFYYIHVEVGSIRIALRQVFTGRFYTSPNGKFAKFELVDSAGHVIPPKPSAGTNLLRVSNLYYRPNLPAWAAPSAGSLVANFPKIISTNIYPLYYKDADMACSISFSPYGGPAVINDLNLYGLYSITNAGDYTLVVQPVLYVRKFDNSEFMNRMDLPSVTTKVHLAPSP